jgi:hypothetical protein
MTINHLTSPTAVKLTISECDRLGRDTFLATYGFRHSREYPLSYAGHEYDSKAIAAVAFGYQYSDRGPLTSGQLSGGIGDQGAATCLIKLGFEISGVKSRRPGWPLIQCETTADAYFQCLKAKLSGRSFNRQQMIRQVADQIKRSEGAVDFKFQNIDAILYEAEQPRLGKAIASEYQKLLKYVVLDPLAKRVAKLLDARILVVATESDNVVVSPPSISPTTDNDRLQRAVKIDFAVKEDRNRSVGLAEKSSLLSSRRSA